MTADEIAYAGGIYGDNEPMWYYTNSSLESSTGSTVWWLLSPSYWGDSYAIVFNVIGSFNPGLLSYKEVNNAYGVRPVVSLKSCTLWSRGDGSSSSPYEIIENGGC